MLNVFLHKQMCLSELTLLGLISLIQLKLWLQLETYKFRASSEHLKLEFCVTEQVASVCYCSDSIIRPH